MELSEVLDLSRSSSAARGRPTLEAVFQASYRRLVVQLFGVVGDRGEAEDLVQEAFVRAASAGRRFAKVDNPEAWLRITAINLHRNRWRKLRNFRRVREGLAAEPTDAPAPETHVAVVEALQRLPEGQRQAVALHYLADLPVGEIAIVLGIAEGTVKSRLTRGREALAVLLGEGEDDA